MPFLLALSVTVQAQFTYTTNSPDTNTITITGYTGPGGSVDIPSIIAGKTITSIGDWAFLRIYSLTSVTIPDSVTNIGVRAFYYCDSLTNIMMPDSVTTIGDWAFHNCDSLTNIRIPDSVTHIGESAFYSCNSLTNIMIPDSVTSIGDWAFASCESLSSVTIGNSVTSIGYRAFICCYGLTSIYFRSNPPIFGMDIFYGDDNSTVYYLPEATDWPTVPDEWAERPTALWLPKAEDDGSLGVQDGEFGFNVGWAIGQTVVVDACTNLIQTNWMPVATNTLTNGTFYFIDTQWTIFSDRFYRLRSPGAETEDVQQAVAGYPPQGVGSPDP